MSDRFGGKADISLAAADHTALPSKADITEPGIIAVSSSVRTAMSCLLTAPCTNVSTSLKRGKPLQPHYKLS
jgi:hypothetical protein